MQDVLRGSLGLDREVLEKAIEKLIAQGCATVDMAGNIRRIASPSQSDWRSNYEAQRGFRRGQIDRMVAFAGTQQCRMAALVSHFGDASDGRRPCGNCDFCAPHQATAQQFVAPTDTQAQHLRAILRVLDASRAKATGKLHAELILGPLSGVDRKAFDVLLDSLARAGLITLTSDTFTNPEGRVLPYKKATRSAARHWRAAFAPSSRPFLRRLYAAQVRRHCTDRSTAKQAHRISSDTADLLAYGAR
jgi:ATP-dependent DNA helicase RecQ